MPFYSPNVNPSDLIFAAHIYTAMEFSVIPILGNADIERFKVAAVPWRQYQQRFPTDSEISTWFSERQYGGLAIVTGAISRLMVLDFDTLEAAEAFQAAFFPLLNTRAVISASRGLPHYYFRIPKGYVLKSRSLNGVDIQAEGRYIIAPPTMLGDKPYQIKTGGRPKQLTIAQIEAILRFFGDYRGLDYAEADTREKSRSALVAPRPPSFSSSDAVALYSHLAPQMGRNCALFHVACRLRDMGWSGDRVIATLSGVHAYQPPHAGKPDEPIPYRHQEAQKSIRSAYRRPPRPLLTAKRMPQLPNVLREHLVREGLTAVARVLDGLLLAGVAMGQSLSEKRINLVLLDRVGRHTILKALRAVCPDGTPIFAPSPSPPSPTSVASKTPQSKNNKCLLFTATKSNKNRPGRPPKQYIIPDVLQLCAKFGLKPRSGDNLALDDVVSARAYRIALHREWLRRRPGCYYRGYMAARLGLSVRTLQRYDHIAAIGSTALYYQRAITWDNLAYIPCEDAPRGTFLSDETGKRYPPKPIIAMRLLQKRHKVLYERRTANYYWVGIFPQAHFDGVSASLFVPPPPPKVKSEHVHIIETGAETPHPPSKKPSRRRKSYRRALDTADQERLALRLYECVREKSAARQQAPFSLATARKLVSQYGPRAVESAIGQLQGRHNIQNPAGFAVILIRGFRFATS